MKKFLIVTLLLTAGPMTLLWRENLPQEVKAANDLVLKKEEVHPKKRMAEEIPPVKPKCELQLTLPARIKIGKRGTKVILKNGGTIPVTLVMPGDGSLSGRRTPITGWSLLPVDSDDDHPRTPPRFGGPICGNINPLKAEEVFSLNPGESKNLGVWAGLPTRNLKPGKYRVAFYYKNDPKLKWRGIPLGAHDPKAMQRIRESTPVDLKSNEQIIELIE